jgi:DNA-binding MarR family transcriptional regulator
MNYNEPENKVESRSAVTGFQLREFQALIAKLFQCCQERMQYQSERFDLPDAELRCLMLFGEERYLTPKGIALKMNVVKSRVTRIILGLENKGFIQRIRDPEDSRIYLLSLTTDGKKKLKEIQSFHDNIHTAILEQMAPDQRNKLLNNLDLLKASMEAGKEMLV